jgi:hypothetical protein
LMDDAALDLGLGKDCQDRFLKAAQSIHTGNENILYPSCLQIGDDT